MKKKIRDSDDFSHCAELPKLGKASQDAYNYKIIMLLSVIKKGKSLGFRAFSPLCLKNINETFF